ncbi:MAG: hypothetical protein ACRD4F_07925, partial [Candidatus Angelobacter sp.]
MFQAVAVANDVNAAKVLAFSFPRMAEGIQQAENKRAELTVVVEDDLDREDDVITFALQTMEQQMIRVTPLAQMRDLAAHAAKELRLM